MVVIVGSDSLETSGQYFAVIFFVSMSSIRYIICRDNTVVVVVPQ